jgi:hypothetical protein
MADAKPSKSRKKSTYDQLQLHCDGRPAIPAADPLLAALIREYGLAGRPDIATPLLVDTWAQAIAVHKLCALFHLAHGRDPDTDELARMIDGRVRSL